MSEQLRKSTSVCLGVFADIQYRDTDDVYVENPGHIRSYRAALPKTVEGSFGSGCCRVPASISWPPSLLFLMNLHDVLS